ncbi:helix-turn-helix transcriptional regulator, partial [Streptomyces albiflaviniger]|nr:helix-turn-helix transcriptional regulator [Streptomyces albiflaviniger]
AGRLGYASPAAFTTAFTRAFGLPPSRFTAGGQGSTAGSQGSCPSRAGRT